MDERIRAHTCTFGEMMRYCFSGIGDNVFQFRLRIAIEREAELKSCFLDAGHRKRFYEGLAYTRKASKNLIAQIFLLSSYESLWVEAKKVLERNCVVYSALEISIKGIDVNPHNLFTTALDLEYGSAHSDLLDLSDDEVTEIGDGYVLIDDTVLCKDKKDGMVFKVLTDELIIRRYLECTNIKVGDTVAVKFQTEIVLGEDNTVSGAISMYKGKVTDDGIAVPE